MHYGLAKLEDSFFAGSLHKCVLLGPCFVGTNVDGLKPADRNHAGMDVSQLGIYATNGPNWTKDLEKICANTSAKTAAFYTSQSGEQGMSTKTWDHWMQNTVADRFQEFNSNWTPDNIETELIDVSNISKVPLSFFVATEDETATYAQSVKYIAKI